MALLPGNSPTNEQKKSHTTAVGVANAHKLVHKSNCGVKIIYLKISRHNKCKTGVLPFSR